MRAVIQRVSEASVTIDEQVVGKIGRGFMILLGIHEEDTQEDADYLIRKIPLLRVFEDAEGKMNQSLQRSECFTIHTICGYEKRKSTKFRKGSPP